MSNNMLKFDSIIYLFSSETITQWIFLELQPTIKNPKKSMNRLHKLHLFIIKVKYFYLQSRHKDRHWCNCVLINLSWLYGADYCIDKRMNGYEEIEMN